MLLILIVPSLADSKPTFRDVQPPPLAGLTINEEGVAPAATVTFRDTEDPAIGEASEQKLVADIIADMRAGPGNGARKVPFTPPEQASVSRDHEWTAVGLSYAVLRQACLDPFALGCLLLVVAYIVANQMMFVKPQEKAAKDSDAASFTSGASSRSRKSRAPDRFALVVNQKLTRLNTVEEVLDFMISSSESGRTDIVNAVTAIHRTAKLVANKPQHERVKVGQDPRTRQLLDQLLAFLTDEQHPASILTRAVGNTSWALAKLQWKDDKEPHMIVETLQNVFVEHAAEFRPEEMMNTVWAFAELRREKDGRTSETRSVAIAEAACKCMDKFPQFTLQQVVYFSWALARLSSINSVKHNSSTARAGLLRFTLQIVDRSRPEVASLDTKNLAMLSWAVASLHANLGLTPGEGNCGVLMNEIAALIVDQGLGGFLPGECASILWAVNKVHVSVPSLYALVQDHLLRKGLRGYSSQDISTITCAFVKTKSGSDELYKLLADGAQKSVKHFNRSEKMMMHWAFTQLPHLTAPKL